MQFILNKHVDMFSKRRRFYSLFKDTALGFQFWKQSHTHRCFVFITASRHDAADNLQRQRQKREGSESEMSSMSSCSLSPVIPPLSLLPSLLVSSHVAVGADVLS